MPNKWVQVKTALFLVVAFVAAVFSLLILRNDAVAAQEELEPQHAFFILMPLVELYSESGPDYDRAVEVHSELLSEYIEAVKSRTPSYYKVFSWKYNPSHIDELNRIQKILIGKNNEKTSEGRIKQARKTALEVFKKLDEFLKVDVNVLKEDRTPYKLRAKIKEVRNESQRAVKDYISDFEKSDIDDVASFFKAQLACQANRKNICYIYFSFLLYQDFHVTKEDLIRFREDIDRVVYYNKRLFETSESLSKDQKNLLLEYSDSENRRRAILQLIIEEDMPKAQLFLLTAMREAIEKSSE